MNKFAKISLAGVMLVCVAATGAEPSDSELGRMVTNVDGLHRVTNQPHQMLDSTIAFCRPPESIPHNLHDGVGGEAFCHVYSNALAKETLVSGHGRYPVGSMIVKSKLRAKDARDIVLFTVMRKMAEGYDASNGNWEYSVLDGKSQRVYARGRIDSCISCHADYRETDFVTRIYLQGDE